MRVLGYPQTYPTKCRECAEHIYFHTNGTGDAVFFDFLGPPWPIHGCYFSRHKGRDVSDWAVYRARMVNLYGKSYVAPKSRPAAISRAPAPRRKQAPAPTGPKPVDIARCEPTNFIGRTLSIVGFVQSLHPGRRLTRFADAGSIGYSAYHKLIGSDVYTQLTVVDSDLVSYTLILPRKTLELRQGAIVGMTIKGLATPGEALFLCTGLNVLEWKDQ